MSAAPNSSRMRRLQGRLLTGPAGHLLGGALDVAGALARYWLARAPAPWRIAGLRRQPQRRR